MDCTRVVAYAVKTVKGGVLEPNSGRRAKRSLASSWNAWILFAWIYSLRFGWERFGSEHSAQTDVFSDYGLAAMEAELCTKASNC